MQDDTSKAPESSADASARWLKGVICVLIFAAAYYFYLRLGQHPNVFRSHLDEAIAMDRGEHFIMHFGIFLLTIVFKHATGLPWVDAFSLLLCFHVVLTYLALTWFLELFCSDLASPRQLCLLGLALMILGPIGLPFIDSRIYSFPIWNRYILLLRNSTYTAAQPYVILAFTYACRLIEREYGRKTVLLAAVTLWLSTLMKPSFAVSFIPALGLFTLLRVRSLRTTLALAAAISLTLVTLPLQYYIGFIDNPIGYHNSFAVDPWVVWENNNVAPLLSLFLAIVFPLYVTLERARRIAPITWLAWINFAIAVVPYALLRETSPQGDRNFEWAVWFGLHVLFLTTVRDWLVWRKKEGARTEQGAVDVATKILLLHIFFGSTKFIYSMANAY